MKKSQPTREYAESRRLHSSIIDEARERIVAQRRIIKYKEYSWYSKQEFERERLDEAHIRTLVESEYSRLRGLYSIPFHFEEFCDHIYRHPSLYRWVINRYWAEKHNSRVASRRRRHHTWDRWGDRTGTYYRQGPAKMSANPQKKVEPVSDQYQVNADVARKDWRDKKQFQRDKAKGTCFCKCRLNDAKAGRRAWERDMIRKEDYEGMDAYHKNMFTDGWDCC